MRSSEDILILVGPDDAADYPQERGWRGWAIQQIHVLPRRGDGMASFEQMRGQLSHEIKRQIDRPAEAGWYVVANTRSVPVQGGRQQAQFRFGGIHRASPLDVALINPSEARDLASAMQSEIDRLKGQVALNREPHLVANAMRSGRIAKPTWHDIEKLYPDEVAEAKAQGVNAAADEIQAIYEREGDDDGIDLWTAGEIVRAQLSPKGWPVLGIRPRPMDWDRHDRLDEATQDRLVASAQPESTGARYDVFHVHDGDYYEVPQLGKRRFDTEKSAMGAVEDDHHSRLLKDLERDVMGGERTALKWLLASLRNGQQKDAVGAMAEDLTESLEKYLGVDLSERGGLMAPLSLSALQASLKAILAQGDLPSATLESENK